MKQQSISTSKRILFICTLILLSVIVFEALVFVSYLVVKRKIFSFEQYYSAMLNTVQEQEGKNSQYADEINTEDQVIHPYLGFVQDPTSDKRVSRYGFFNDGIEPIFSREQNKLIIGIFGGSFATGVFLHAKERLVEKLKDLDKEIIILNIALGGYKQPQQLMALTYLLSLGADFDIVINLDGFNDVALPSAENQPQGVFPIYPRSWYFRVAALDDPNLITKLAKLETLYNSRENWARTFANSFLHNSFSGCLLWRSVDKLIEKNITTLLLTLKKARLSTSNYRVTGPSYSFSTEEDFYDFLALYWKRCSLQMKEVCEMRHIKYFHFLQPNQYYENSKPMEEVEIRIALRDDQPYKQGVVSGYPYLRHYGEELIKEGVNFSDLTMLLSDIYTPLYADDCCHLNKQGYEIIANKIGEIILHDYQEMQ